MALNKEKILPFALQNAAQYGKADTGAVFGKVMGTFPEAREDIARTRKLVADTVTEVNALPAAERETRLEKLSLPKKEPDKKQDLPDLPEAVMGKVVTRFAPAPTGALSLFHVLRPIMINYLYAKKYKGRFLVRLEDTDPEKVEKPFYRWIAEDLKALGVRWNRLTRESDEMPAYYAAARKLIAAGRVYACFCPAETFKELKVQKKDCPCRAAPAEKNMRCFEDAQKKKYGEGTVVFRFKTSMQDPNPAIRDPPLLRVVDSPHPLKGARYTLWPLYNFANTVSDHRQGITHVFRGKEHENNSTIQDRLYAALGWKPPMTLNFGMIRLETGTLHKRDIKKMIAEKTISGWDDPKLPTVRALLRRGFQPPAFVQAALSVGLTKNDITFTIDKLETANRRLIDPKANRYMAVLEPVAIQVTGAPKKTTVLEPLHPDFPKKGTKRMSFVSSGVYLSKEDYTALQNKTFRLKGFGNIRLEGKNAAYTGNELVQEMPKVQWVSEPLPILLRTPTGDRKGLGEAAMKTLRKGQLIQLERIGFCRVDSLRPLVLWFAHR